MVFEEAIELEYPLVLLEPLAFLLARLLDQLCARLGARALASQELNLDLTLECAPDHVGTGAPARPGRAQARQIFHRTLRLPVPLLDAKVFLKLLQLDLNAHPPGAPIVKIHLSAEPVRPRAAQSGLFRPPSPEPEKLELTLARIAGIVGENKVGSLQLLDTHRPEAFRMRRFAPQLEEQAARKPKKASRNDKPGESQKENEVTVTAMRIFRPPLRATITLQEGRPAHIACLKRKEICGEILWAAGPWRTSGDWWEQEGWARDEWDIALQEASGITLYRLVRDLLSGQWRVEGNYD